MNELRKEVTPGRCEGVIDVGPCVCIQVEGGNSESLCMILCIESM